MSDLPEHLRPPEVPDDYDTVREAIEDWMAGTTARERVGGRRDPAVDMAVRAHLVRMKLEGMSFAEIARRYGYADRSAVRQAVMRSLRREEDENRADLVAVESAALDYAAAALMPKVLAGDARAHDTWLRNRARYARLHGLDAPLQVAISAGAEAELADAISEVQTVIGQVLDGGFPQHGEPPALEA